MPYGRETDLRVRQDVAYVWNNDLYARDNESHGRYDDVRQAGNVV